MPWRLFSVIYIWWYFRNCKCNYTNMKLARSWEVVILLKYFVQCCNATYYFRSIPSIKICLSLGECKKTVLRANVQRSSYMSFAFNSIIEGHIQVNDCLACFITNTLTSVSSITNSLTCSLHVSFLVYLGPVAFIIRSSL